MAKFAFFILLLASLVLTKSINSAECPSHWDLMPVVYKDRIRPLDASASLWLQDVYHKETLMPEHRSLLNLKYGSAVEFFWKMHTVEDHILERLPLFWIGDKEMKTFLGLDTALERFTFLDLKGVFEDTLYTNLKILDELIVDAFIKTTGKATFYPGEKVLLRIINADIECELLEKNLLVKHAPPIVPWHYLSALCFSSSYAIRLPIDRTKENWNGLYLLMRNFLQYKDLMLSKTVVDTLFLSPFRSDFSFAAVNLSHLHQWILSSAFRTLPPKKIASSIEQFFSEYDGILKHKRVPYPSMLQLKAESLLSKYRLFSPITVLYGFGVIFLLWFMSTEANRLLAKTLVWSCIGSAMILHAYVLVLKMFLKENFPFLTFIDVGIFASWMAVVFGAFIFCTFNKRGLLIFSILGSCVLFMMLWIADGQQAIVPDHLFGERVSIILQQTTKTISFLLLLAGGLIAHFALMLNKKCALSLENCLYGGTLSLLISLLTGGIWDESGNGLKFLEWGTQESWGLLTLSFYSLLIYLGNYKLFASTAVLMGSCMGTIILGWGWVKNPHLLSVGIEGASNLFYPGLILLEAFFIVAMMIRKSEYSSEHVS